MFRSRPEARPTVPTAVRRTNWSGLVALEGFPTVVLAGPSRQHRGQLATAVPPRTEPMSQCPNQILAVFAPDDSAPLRKSFDEQVKTEGEIELDFSRCPNQISAATTAQGSTTPATPRLINSALTRCSMSSRIGRIASTDCPAGSASSQFS